MEGLDIESVLSENTAAASDSAPAFSLHSGPHFQKRIVPINHLDNKTGSRLKNKHIINIYLDTKDKCHCFACTNNNNHILNRTS